MNRIFKLKCSLFLGDRVILRRVISGILVLLLVPINIFFLNLSLDTDSTVKYFIYNSIVSSIVCGVSVYTLLKPLDLYEGIDGSVHVISVVVIYFIVALIYSKDIISKGIIQFNGEVINSSSTISFIICGVLGSLGNTVCSLIPGLLISGIIRSRKKIE